MEQRAADPQQPVLVQLGGPGGPAELVVAVSPDVADHEGRQAQVGKDHPQEFGHARTPGKVGVGSSTVRCRSVGAPGLNWGLANGDSPTSSSGGPAIASRRTASRSSPRSGGSVADTASSTDDPGRALVAQREAQQLEPRPVLEDQLPTGFLVHRGGVLQHHAQVVGELGVVEGEPGAQVGLLEAQQRHPALAGVAVREVGEEQVAAAAGVEGVDVVGLQLGQRGRLEVPRKGVHRLTDRGRQPLCRGSDQVELAEQPLVGVAEQQRGRLPGDQQLLRASTRLGDRGLT